MGEKEERLEIQVEIRRERKVSRRWEKERYRNILRDRYIHVHKEGELDKQIDREGGPDRDRGKEKEKLPPRVTTTTTTEVPSSTGRGTVERGTMERGAGCVWQEAWRRYGSAGGGPERWHGRSYAQRTSACVGRARQRFPVAVSFFSLFAVLFRSLRFSFSLCGSFSLTVVLFLSFF